MIGSLALILLSTTPTAAPAVPSAYTACIEQEAQGKRTRRRVRYTDEYLADAIRACADEADLPDSELMTPLYAERLTALYVATRAQVEAMPKPAAPAAPLIATMPAPRRNPTPETASIDTKAELAVLADPWTRCVVANFGETEQGADADAFLKAMAVGERACARAARIADGEARTLLSLDGVGTAQAEEAVNFNWAYARMRALLKMSIERGVDLDAVGKSLQRDRDAAQEPTPGLPLPPVDPRD